MIVFSEPPAKQEWIHENPWRSHIFLYIFPCSERKNSRKTFGFFSRLCQMMSDVYPSFFVPNVNSPWFLTFSKANLPSKQSEADLPEKPTSAQDLADVQDEVTDGGGLGWSGGWLWGWKNPPGAWISLGSTRTWRYWASSFGDIHIWEGCSPDAGHNVYWCVLYIL